MTKNQYLNPANDPMRKPKKIDLDLISNFLKTRGFAVLSIEQPWRNINGFVRKNGQDLFFKMGTNPEISESIENDILFLQHLQQNLDPKKYDQPKVVETGKYKSLNWYLSTKINEQPLSGKKEAGSLPDNLAKAAQLAIDVMNLPAIDLPRDDKFEGQDLGNVLYQKSQGFAKDSDRNCDQLLKLIRQYKDGLKTNLNHGDFAPYQILISKDGRLSLIDGEHACTNVKHYDAAYFYQRTYTILERPDLAKKFLKKYFNLLPIEMRKSFNRDFLPVIAQRNVGGYFDYKFGANTSLEKQEQLEAEILSEKIL